MMPAGQLRAKSSSDALIHFQLNSKVLQRRERWCVPLGGANRNVTLPSSWAGSASGMGLAAAVATRPKMATRAVIFMVSVIWKCWVNILD